MQIAFSERRSKPFSSAMLSMIMLEPREASSANKPQLTDAAKADATLTRQAIFPKGKILVNIHVNTVHTGYPGGCGTPAYIEPTANSPESSSVRSGDNVSM